MQNFIQNRVFGNSDAGINLSNKVIQESGFTALDVSVLNVRHTTFNSCEFRSCDFTTQMIEDAFSTTAIFRIANSKERAC